MRKVNSKYVDGLVSKVLKETLEERADELMSKIKTNVNELGGMDSDHPKFGKMNFSKMSPEEIEDMMNNYIDDESDDKWTEIDVEDETDDSHEGNWVHPLGEDEMEEGFDDPFIQRARGGRDYSSSEFKRIPKGAKIDTTNYRDDSITPSKYMGNKLNDIDDLFRKHFGDDDDDDFNLDDINIDDLMTEGESEICECGGNIYEGECNECGASYMDESDCQLEEDIDDVEDLNKSNEFDYVEEDESGVKDYSIKGESNPEGCKAIMDTIKKYGETEVEREALERYKSDDVKGLSKNSRIEANESLKRGKKKQSRGQDYIARQAEPKDKIDAKDFKVLRDKKSKSEKEVEEGNEFTGQLAKAKKEGKSSFSVDGKKYPVKESIQLTEDELVELIENIIKEEEKLLIKGGVPKGLSKYKEVHAKDGKENDEYLKSVAAKMKDYLKDGSKGEYDESPKHFPKGNGQLEKMKAKKYTMSDDGNDFLNSYMRPGMEDLVPEEIEYDEDWVSDSIEGSARTGNSPKYANAEETDLGKKINKKRKDKKFHKAKETAYRKTRVPVSDGTGENSGSGIHIKESDEKKTKVLNEEFNKIQKLMNYNRKTQ